MAGNLAELQRQLESGLAMHRLGKLGLAESHYARVVKLDPAQTEAWHLLGVVAFQSGNAAKAIKHYRKAVELRPGFAQAWNNLAIALKSRGELDAAANAFARALAARPEYVEAAFNLALLHEAAGRGAEAEAAYRQALAWEAGNVGALTNLGNLLVRLGRANQARDLLARAHDSEQSAASAGNLAVALLELARYVEARELAMQAAAAEPDVATWWSVAGSAARLSGDMEAALPALERATQLAPNDALGWLELGLAQSATGDDAGARASTARARELAPDSVSIRWREALLLPTIVASEAEVDEAIASFGDGVERLLREVRGVELEALSNASSYHLHYLPRDTTALQFRFGDLLVAASPPAVPTGRARGARLRVGFASAYFGRHTVSRYFNALIAGLDPRRFERFVWHTGEALDGTARALAAAVEHFEHAAAPAQAIRDAALDVLVFPDVGMDPRQNLLAAQRLAPVQVALAGHPVTTGLPTIDAFFSGALLEPEGAERHYRERLVRLPGIGAAPSRPDVAPDRAWFESIRDARPALLCLQNLSKLTPEFERALARIAEAASARIYCFDRGPSLTKRCLARLPFLTALPVCPYAEFLGAIAGAGLVLDTPWFSGGGTSLDAFALGVPVVAWESPFARGRQTSAMLKAMGLPELIATDADAYVALARGLLDDAVRRDHLGVAIAERSQVLFDAAPVVSAFGDALVAISSA